MGLVCPQTAKKPPRIFRIQMCAILFMTTCYLSPIQSLINSLHHLPSFVFQVVSFLIVSLLKPCRHFTSIPHIAHALCIPFFVILSLELLDSKNHVATYYIIPFFFSYTLPLRANYFLNTLFSTILNLCSSLRVR